MFNISYALVIETKKVLNSVSLYIGDTPVYYMINKMVKLSF